MVCLIFLSIFIVHYTISFIFSNIHINLSVLQEVNLNKRTSVASMNVCHGWIM